MARMVEIGQMRWVAGLQWTTFEDIPGKDEIKKDAELWGAQFVSVRVGASTVQAGFCEQIEGGRPSQKYFSLAAMLADSRAQPWLGVFKIAEGLWWYIAVRDGHSILPDGDVIGGEAEILAARERHSGYGDWNYVEGDLSLLAELIRDIPTKPTKLRPIHVKHFWKNPVLMIGLLIGFVAVVGGIYATVTYLKQQEEEERKRMMASMRAQMEANKPPVQVVLSAIQSAPDPDHWLNTCGAILSNVQVSNFGWEPTSRSCNATTAMVHWSRSDGATVEQRPPGELQPDGNGVEQIILLDDIAPSNTDNGTDIANEKLILRAWAQKAGIILSFTEDAPPVVLPGASPLANTNRPASPAAAVSHVAFALDILISPFGVNFSHVPGLRLTSLKTTDAGWHIEGVLYGH